jgi:hypothetical protein
LPINFSLIFILHKLLQKSDKQKLKIIEKIIIFLNFLFEIGMKKIVASSTIKKKKNYTRHWRLKFVQFFFIVWQTKLFGDSGIFIKKTKNIKITKNNQNRAFFSRIFEKSQNSRFHNFSWSRK